MGRWTPATGDHARDLRLELRRLTNDVEQGLRGIDFEEVTTEDRITFVEAVVAWQVRRALRGGRFDLAVELQRFGAKRIARLHEGRYGWRPVMLYGVPVTTRREP